MPAPIENYEQAASAVPEHEWKIFDTALANTADCLYVFDLDGRFTYINLQLLALRQKSLEEAVGKNFYDLGYPSVLAAALQTQLEKVIQTGERLRGETPFSDDNGVLRYYEHVFAPILSATGAVEAVAGSTRDITDRKRNEEGLRETAKLESIGTLAGGIAHDFNNLLTGIMGNAHLARELLSSSHPAYRMLNEVLMASERAALLTGQLLAYAGRGRFFRARLNVAAAVKEITGLVRGSVPPSVRLSLRLSEDPQLIEADTAQIQQIVTNLISNAAEAIGDSEGNIHISVSGCYLNERSIKALKLPIPAEITPANYVCIEVEDDGCGMDPVTQEKMFDPFFTTKFFGRGLGLSAVGGIIRSHKGAIRVDSEPGCGTRIRVYLRLAEDPENDPELAQPAGTQRKPGGPKPPIPTTFVADEVLNSTGQ